MRLLICEDYPKINHLIALFAKQHDHVVSQAFSAEEALDLLKEEAFDAIVLDLMLPGMQGEDLIKEMRSFSDLYIVVVSAKIDVKERIDVIKLGADDYLTKPFSVDELMVKLDNVEKRLDHKRPNILSFNQGYLKIQPLKRTVYVAGKVTGFTEYEFDVLLYLSNHQGEVLSRARLFDACLTESDGFDRVIDTFIKNIRKKIDDDHHLFIKTHYGVGYEFVGVLDA